jgi:hypothetical protein
LSNPAPVYRLTGGQFQFSRLARAIRFFAGFSGGADLKLAGDPAEGLQA